MGSITNIILVFYTYILVHTDTQSTEDDQPYTNAYVPSSINFQDIYTNVLGKQAESSVSEETDAPNIIILPEFSEFNPKSFVTTSTSSTSPKNVNDTDLNNTDISTTTDINNNDKKNGDTTPKIVEEETDEPIEVVPIRHYERGVLDILLPPNRVKMFKNMFDSFRRILSYTF